MSSDLVSALDARAYFQYRNIEVSTDKLAELATTDPKDAKSQVAQLLALRQLAEDATTVKKAKNYQEILARVEAVAEGKKAQDPQGFAAEYAQVAAAALGSTKVERPVRTLPENSARQDAFAWFPASVKIVAAQDFRTGEPVSFESGKAMRQLYAQFMPPQVREELFKLADRLGNVRADRIAVAFTPDPQNPGGGRLYLRLTGRGNPRWLLNVMKEENKDATVKEQKSFRGPRVTVVTFRGAGSPALALVGDTDLVLAGEESGPRILGPLPHNPLADVEAVLAVRAGREKNVLAGPLGKSLKKLSPRASAVAVGELPDAMRSGLLQPGGFTVFPKTVRAEMVRNKKGATVRWEGKLDSAEDARAFVADVDRLKKAGIEAMKEAQKNLPPGLPLPANTFKVMARVLESVKAEANDRAARGTVHIPDEGMSLLANFGALGVNAVPAAPPAAPAPAPKVEKTPRRPRGETRKERRPDQGSALAVPGRFLARAELTRRQSAIACLDEYADRR